MHQDIAQFGDLIPLHLRVLANQSAQNYTATAIGQGNGLLSQCDVNGDSKLGLAEVIYILQMLSGKR